MKDGSLSKSALNWTQADVNNQFIAGKAAMMINGPWQIPALERGQGPATTASSRFRCNKAGQVAQAPLGGEVWTVPQTGNADNEKNAAKIVACLNSDENQIAMAAARGTVPSKITLGAEFAEEGTGAWPRSPRRWRRPAPARRASARLAKAATKIYTAVQSALTGEAIPGRTRSSSAASTLS